MLLIYNEQLGPENSGIKEKLQTEMDAKFPIIMEFLIFQNIDF